MEGYPGRCRSAADGRFGGCGQPRDPSRRQDRVTPSPQFDLERCGKRWKWPTLTHSVRPRRVRRAIGWCTWPNTAQRRAGARRSPRAGPARTSPAGPAPRRSAAAAIAAGCASTACRPARARRPRPVVVARTASAAASTGDRRAEARSRAGDWPRRRRSPAAGRRSRRPRRPGTAARPPATSFQMVGDVDVAQGQQGVRDRPRRSTSRYRAATTSVRVPTGSGVLSHRLAVELAQRRGSRRPARSAMNGWTRRCAEDPAEDAAGRVVVVDVVQQVAEHDELLAPRRATSASASMLPWMSETNERRTRLTVMTR